MNLVDDGFIPNTNKDNTNKTKKIILILIIILAIAIVITLIAIALLKNNTEKKLTVTVDGVSQEAIVDMIMKTEDNKIYIPIRDIAQYLNYDSFNGNYTNKSEEKSQCYIETNEEVANFTANSNILEKIDKNTQNKTTYELDEKVEMVDGKLYAISSAIETAFNVFFEVKEQEINIYTMDYLIEIYKPRIIEQGYKDISDEFNDKKTIFDGFLIVKNNNNQYGVFNADTNEILLETKYDKIEYIPEFKDFLVESNGKKGIITSTGKETIGINYDDIALISQELKLYLVKIDKKYGVINENEETVIPINCDRIGIDINRFKKNSLTNEYILLDQIIPVSRNDLWGFYDIKGNLVAKYGYDDFGCTSAKERNAEGLIVIPEYNVIIARKENEYYLVDTEGNKLFNGTTFDSAYILIENNQVLYCVTKDDKKYNASDMIEEWYKKTGKTNEEQNNNKEEITTNQNNDE